MKKITLITPFPNKGEVHAKNTGVGSYSFFLAEELGKIMHVEVWAQIASGTESYVDKNIEVKRVWRKNFFSWIDITAYLWRERPDIIHVQHELNIFGGALAAIFSPIIFFVARVLSIQVITTMHGGFGLSNVDSNFIKENGYALPPVLIKGSFLFIFGLIAHFSHKIIVHEDWQKEELFREYFVSKRKIFIIPHGVPNNVDIVDNAKSLLGINGSTRVYLYMGFAARYKGLPELYEVYRQYIAQPDNDDTILIVGAGPSPRLENDREYMNWYKDLKNKYESLGDKARWVGFIPSDQIPIYYSAADAVLFPYSRRLAASGPMAIAIGYERDIFLSSVLEGKREYEFSLANVVQTRFIKSERTWGKITQKTEELYFKTL